MRNTRDDVGTKGLNEHGSEDGSLHHFGDDVQATMMGALVQSAGRSDGGDGSYGPVDDMDTPRTLKQLHWMRATGVDHMTTPAKAGPDHLFLRT